MCFRICTSPNYTTLTLKVIANISREKRMKITKIAKHMNQRAIVKELGISRSSISEILSKFQGTGSVSNRPRWGCPRNMQHRKLTWTAKEDCKTSDVWGQLVQFGVSRCHSANTLRKWTEKVHCRLETNINQKAFEGKIKMYEPWDSDAWNKIIFSNETRTALAF